MPEHCRYCFGKCVMNPPMTPQKVGNSIHDLNIDPANIYRLGDWGVNIDLNEPYRGYKLHLHWNGWYGVFNHYFGMGIEPILICSGCKEEIPASTFNTLKAAHRLWHKE